MSITALNQNRIGDVITVTATSSLTGGAGGVIYFYWYLDGAYAGMSTGNDAGGGVSRKTFSLTGQAVVDVLDSIAPPTAFDPVASAPENFPARRALVFVRSTDAAVKKYRIDQQENGGPWEEIARIPHDPAAWDYTFLTDRLDDLTLYAWRVVPLDLAGNAGDAVTIAQELIVRTPDAPDFTATLQGSTQVAFAAA